MAKKNDIDISNNFDDFGDFDFNVDESGVKRNQVAQPSKLRSDYMPSLNSGILEGLKQEIRSKMPFTAAAVDEVSAVYNEARNMTQQFISDATPLVRSLGRSTNRLMPLVRPFMPKGVYDKITGKLNAIPAEQGEMSEEERQSQQISADINAAFQGSDANAQVRSNMETVVGNMRHKATLGVLGGLSKQMQSITAFLTTSMMAYMKKDLELQYRQLYTQRDIASALRGTAKLLDVELKNITHNTGLPETIKQKDFEKRTSKREKIKDRVANFWKNAFSNFRANILDQIKEGIGMAEQAATMGADSMEMMQEMGQNVDAKSLLTKGAFNLFGKLVGSKLGKKIAGVSQYAINGFENGFENFSEDVVRGAEKFAQKDNILARFVSMFLPNRPVLDNRVQNVLEANPMRAVQFDISTREAIVTIIPGYLAKIQKSVAQIQNPESQTGELIYDTHRLEFVDKDAIVDRAKDTLNKVLNPETWGIHDHLGILTAGRVARNGLGDKVKTARDVKAFLAKKGKDGVTYREKLTRFFINLARMADHHFDVEALEAGYTNKDTTQEYSDYYTTAIAGLGDEAHEIVGWILDSLTGKDGKYNGYLINNYNSLLSRIAKNIEVNEASENFSKIVNDSAPEIRDAVMKYAEQMGVFDRERMTLDINAMNKATSAKLAREDLTKQYSVFLNDKYIQSATTTNAGLSVEQLAFNLLNKANEKVVSPIYAAGKDEYAKLRDALGKVFSETGTNLAHWGSSMARTIFGDDALKTFELMSDALVKRYKQEGGAEMLALDVAMLSDGVSEEDKAVINLYMEASISAKKDSDISKYRMKALQDIKDEGVRGIFAGATQYINTRVDAVNSFGTMKQRLELLKNEECYKNVKSIFTDNIKSWKDKAKEKAEQAKERFNEAVSRATSQMTGESAQSMLNQFVRADLPVPERVSRKKYEQMVKAYMKSHKGVKKAQARRIIDAQLEEEKRKFQEAYANRNIHGEDGKTLRETVEGEKPKTNAAETSTASTTETAEDGEKKPGIFQRISSGLKSTWDFLHAAPSDIVESVKEAMKQADLISDRLRSTSDDVTAIRHLLEKRFGAITDEELKEFLKAKINDAKEQQDEKDKADTKSRKGPGVFKKGLKFAGLLIAELNPFKADARKIAAKYDIGNDPESRFHATFMQYFAYRKEMDILMASYAKNNTMFGALGNVAKGVAGLSYHVTKATLSASKYFGGKLISGTTKVGAAALHGLFYKVKTGKNFYNIYRKDQLEKGGAPLLTAEEQENPGVFMLLNPGEEKPRWRLVEYSAQIKCPVYDYKKESIRINTEDIAAGLVDGEGRDITTLTPREYSGLIPTVAKAAIETGKIGFTVTRDIASVGKNVVKDVTYAPLSWAYKKIATWGENAQKKKLEKMFLDLYVVGKKGKKPKLLLSAKDQADGIFDVHTGNLIKRTIDINGPVANRDGKIVVSDQNIADGLVTFDGMKISELAALNTHRGNTFGESVGEGFKNLGGFLKNSALGVGKLLDISKIFAGAGGALLKGVGAVGLHALDFGLSGLERLFSFDGMNEKRFIKKYKPLTNRLDTMVKYLNDIRIGVSKGVKPGAVNGDADGDGDRDNSYGDQQEEAAKAEEKKDRKSIKNAILGIFGRMKDKDGKVKKVDKPWWQKLFEWCKSKDGLLGLLGSTAKLLGGALVTGGAIYLTYKAVKAIAEWVAKFKEKDPEALAEAGNAVKIAKVANAASHAGKAFKAAHLGTQASREAAAAKAAKAAKAGKAADTAADSAKAVKAAKGVRVTPTGVKLTDAAGKPRSVKAITKDLQKQGLTRSAARNAAHNLLANVDDAAKTARNVSQAANKSLTAPAAAANKPWYKIVGEFFTKHAGTSMKNAVGGGRDGKAVASCFNNFMRVMDAAECQSFFGWIGGSLAYVITGGKAPSFILDTIKACDKISSGAVWTAQHIGTMVKFFKDVVVRGMQMFKIGRVFLFLAGFLKAIINTLVKVVMLIPPRVMSILCEGLQELFDWMAYSKAIEDLDDVYLDEYRAGQWSVFGSYTAGVALKAVDIAAFTAAWGFNPWVAGTKVLMELTREIRTSAVQAEISIQNAKLGINKSASNDSMAASTTTRKIKSKDIKDRSKDLQDAVGKQDIDVSDQEKHTSSAWNLGGRMGESFADWRTRDERKSARKSEHQRFIAEITAALDTNIYLQVKGFAYDLLKLLEIAYTEQKAASNHPWGYAVVSAIRSFACTKDPKNLLELANEASDYVNKRRKAKDIHQQAREYVWGKCSITLAQLTDHVNGITKAAEKKKMAEKIAASVKASSTVPKAPTAHPESVKKQEERYKKLDSIFTTSKVQTKDAYTNHGDVVAEIVKHKWPEDGVYEYDNAIFVFATTDMKEDNEDECDKAEAHLRLRIVPMLRDRYPTLPKTVRTDSARFTVNTVDYYSTGKDNHYYMVITLKKEDILRQRGQKEDAPVLTSSVKPDAAKPATASKPTPINKEPVTIPTVPPVPASAQTANSEPEKKQPEKSPTEDKKEPVKTAPTASPVSAVPVEKKPLSAETKTAPKPAPIKKPDSVLVPASANNVVLPTLKGKALPSSQATIQRAQEGKAADYDYSKDWASQIKLPDTSIQGMVGSVSQSVAKSTFLTNLHQDQWNGRVAIINALKDSGKFPLEGAYRAGNACFTFIMLRDGQLDAKVLSQLDGFVKDTKPDNDIKKFVLNRFWDLCKASWLELPNAMPAKFDYDIPSVTKLTPERGRPIARVVVCCKWADLSAHFKKENAEQAKKADEEFRASVAAREAKKAEISQADEFDKKAKELFNQTGANENDVYRNATAIASNLTDRKWPVDTAYTLGNAVFVFKRLDLTKSKPEERKSAISAAQTSGVIGLIQGHYDKVPGDAQLKTGKVCISGYNRYEINGEENVYYLCMAYEKSEILSLNKTAEERKTSEAPESAKSALPKKRVVTTDTTVAPAKSIKTPSKLEIPGDLIEKIGNEAKSKNEFKEKIAAYLKEKYPTARPAQIDNAIQMALESYRWDTRKGFAADPTEEKALAEKKDFLRHMTSNELVQKEGRADGKDLSEQLDDLKSLIPPEKLAEFQKDNASKEEIKTRIEAYLKENYKGKAALDPAFLKGLKSRTDKQLALTSDEQAVGVKTDVAEIPGDVVWKLSKDCKTHPEFRKKLLDYVKTHYATLTATEQWGLVDAAVKKYVDYVKPQSKYSEVPESIKADVTKPTNLVKAAPVLKPASMQTPAKPVVEPVKPAKTEEQVKAEQAKISKEEQAKRDAELLNTLRQIFGPMNDYFRQSLNYQKLSTELLNANGEQSAEQSAALQQQLGTLGQTNVAIAGLIKQQPQPQYGPLRSKVPQYGKPMIEVAQGVPQGGR